MVKLKAPSSIKDDNVHFFEKRLVIFSQDSCLIKYLKKKRRMSEIDQEGETYKLK